MADLQLKRTPSAAMLEAGEKAVNETFEQYRTDVLRDGGRIQMLVNVWRAMAAEFEIERLRAAGVKGSDHG